MIPGIRVRSQQLWKSDFTSPKELVAWMGAIQGQDYVMAKWAVATRLKDAKLQVVEEALAKGEILRTHVMRPTWHLVAAEDIRWMIKLSGKRIKSANESFWKKLEINPELYKKGNKLLEKILAGNKHCTKQELVEVFNKEGILTDTSRINIFLMQAEAEGVICSGADKGNKVTYALLEERVAPAKELHREEALARLAKRYFQSHSPAGFNDFVWWSGLTIREARQGISLIENELIKERFGETEVFIHENWHGCYVKPDNCLSLLPPYDEYLVSYKDRSAVLLSAHYHKAFNKWGIFYPVILYNGKIIGNWKKTGKGKDVYVETSFFEPDFSVDERLLAGEINKYTSYLQ